MAYPPSDAIVDVADSSFIFGSVGSGDARLTINGQPVRVWPNGAWLAFLPFPSDTLARFDLRASNATDSASLTYLIHRTPGRAAPPPGATVWIDTLSLAPRGRVWLGRDEYLPLSVRASEGAEVRMRLFDGTIVPLVAQPEAGEVSEGVRVFGGVLRGRTAGPDPGPVLPAAGYVTPPAYGSDTVWATVEAISGADTARARWPLQVALLDTLPVLAELDDDTARAGTTDSTTTGRALPGGTYAWFFATGTRVGVSGRRDGDVRLKLSSSAEAWVPAPDVRPLPRRTSGGHGGRGLGNALPGRGLRDAARAGQPATSLSHHRERARPRAPLLRRRRRRELDSLWRKRLPGAQDKLGADVRRRGDDHRRARPTGMGIPHPVEGNDLLLDIRRPPVLDGGNPLSGRLIAVDPGHPPGGAIGPTGLREAEANLAVALDLRRLLAGAGARVLMTRTEDIAVDLAPRVAMAERADADVLLSIHNNALPDGIDPFTHHGTSVYYNHPGSIPLARAIQGELEQDLN